MRFNLAKLSAAAEVELVLPVSGTRTPTKRTLISNSVVMALANLAGRGLGYAYIILMAKRLEPRYLGAYAILATASMLVELVSNLGLDKILVREIASGTPGVGQGYFLAALPVRLATAAATASIAWFLLLAFFGTRLLTTSLSVAVFLCAIFPIVVARNCEAFLTAHEQLLPVALSQVCERVVILIAVVILAMGRLRFGALLCIAPLASSIRLLVVGYSTLRIWQGEARLQRPQMVKFFRQSIELLSVEVLALVYFRSDVFLVANMSGLQSAAVYQISYKIFDLCISLFSGFLQAVFPRMVRDRSRASLLRILATGTSILMVPVCLITAGRHLILGALRPEYLAGSTSLVWLMLTVPLVYITSTFANAAIAAGHARILIACAVLLIASNFSLNLILIPRYSINGAAFSTFACEMLSAIVLVPFVFKKLSFCEGEA